MKDSNSGPMSCNLDVLGIIKSGLALQNHVAQGHAERMQAGSLGGCHPVSTERQKDHLDPA